MDYPAFLQHVIDRGLMNLEKRDSITRHPARLRGSREGFHACRGKTLPELAALLDLAHKTSENVRRTAGDEDEEIERYWRARYFELQVKFVCSAVAAANESNFTRGATAASNDDPKETKESAKFHDPQSRLTISRLRDVRRKVAHLGYGRKPFTGKPTQ
jgi:hypothetical protein